MKRLSMLWLGLMLPLGAQEIPVMKLTLQEPITIKVGAKQATILQFPRKVTGLMGYGLTDGKEPGSYHYAHPKDSHLLSLRNLMPKTEADIGVLLGRDLFLFHLVPDANAPAAIRLVDVDQRTRSKPRKVSAASLEERQLDYGTDKLLQLLKLARNQRVFQAYLPHLYQDVETRLTDLKYDDGSVVSVIRQLYRFPSEDAVVLIGIIQNRLDYPIQIDPGSFEARVGERVYPVVLVDAAEIVPAKATIPVHVIVKGDSEGNRANVSIKNDIRLVLSAYARYEEPDLELTGYVDPSLFGDQGREEVMSRVLALFKTRTGAGVLFLIGMFVVFYFIREYRERQGTPTEPVVTDGSALLGQMSPEENQPEPDKPVASEWVKENKLSRFRPPSTSQSPPTQPAASANKSAAQKVSVPKLIHFYEEPKAESVTADVEPPRRFAPSGTLIPCQLIVTVDSSSLETPVVGFVMEDVWHNRQLIVPAGTEVHGSAKRSRVRDRIEVSGTWKFVWQDGREYQIKGLALDRDHDPDKDSYGLTDGSAGIRGEIAKTDQFLEFKLFAATMIGGAARAGESSAETIFGSRPENSITNAGLEGVSTVAERYAKLMLDQIEGDGLFVRVPAGTEFYVYTLQVFEPELASVAGLTQGDQPRNSWEPETAPANHPTSAQAKPKSIDEILSQRDLLLGSISRREQQKENP